MPKGKNDNSLSEIPKEKCSLFGNPLLGNSEQRPVRLDFYKMNEVS